LGLLRLLGDLPDISELRLLYYYDGKKLDIYFAADGSTLLHKEIADIFVNGFSGGVCGFEKIETTPVIPRFSHAVNVLRRDGFIPSSVEKAVNPNALDYYYNLQPFEPNTSCDHMQLEQALSQLREPVTIEISAKPFDVCNHVRQVAAYQRRLKAINDSFQADHFSGLRPGGEWTGIDRNQRVNDPVVDDVRKAMSKMQLSLTRPNLKYAIEISSTTLSRAQYIASVFAENAYKAGSYQLLTANEVAKTQQNASRLFKDLLELRSIATVEELESSFSPPIAGLRKPSIIRCHTDPPDYPENKILVIGEDIMASTKHRAILRGPPIRLLDRHTAVFGTTGSGKSTLTFSMLLQLAKRGIPFLVIEAGDKTDYRAMIEALKRHPDKKMRKLGRKIRLLTPGEESISPLRLNPFLPPENVPIMLHAEKMLGCLLASADWPDPLPAILKKGMYAMYHDFQFNHIKPTIKRLRECTQHELDKLSYSGTVKGEIQAALDARFSEFTTGAIGRIFQTDSNSPSLEDMTSGFTIIECAMLADNAIAFVVFALITMISERFSVIPYSDIDPRLCIFLDEAQTLIPPVPWDTIGAVDSPKAKASRLFCKELLQARSKSYSYVVITQSPTNVDSNVLKICTTTILGKQRETGDIQLLAGSMMFGQADYAAVKQLNTGEFLVFTEGYRRSCLVQAPDICSELGLNGSPFGRAVLEHIENTDWYKTNLRIRVTEELTMLKKRLGIFEDRLDKAIKAVEAILKARGLQKQQGDGTERLISTMLQVVEDFFRVEMVPLAGLDNELKLPPDIEQFRGILIKRFEVSKNMVNTFITAINKKKGTNHGKDK